MYGHPHHAEWSRRHRVAANRQKWLRIAARIGQAVVVVLIVGAMCWVG